jgi:hypothetical protein
LGLPGLGQDACTPEHGRNPRVDNKTPISDSISCLEWLHHVRACNSYVSHVLGPRLGKKRATSRYVPLNFFIYHLLPNCTSNSFKASSSSELMSWIGPVKAGGFFAKTQSAAMGGYGAGPVANAVRACAGLSSAALAYHAYKIGKRCVPKS